MVRKLVLSLIALMGVCAVAFAQNKLVSGTVVDTDGLPVIGAAVVVDGTTTGTSTGADGSFSLPVPANGTLVVSFIGYQSQTIPVGGRTRLDVVLTPETTSIDNVVVVGYGSGSKVGTTIGSSVKVKSEQLENRPTANIADALQGKVAGLQVYSSSGAPDAISTMRLHGVGSLTAGTDPLLVVDGVPVSMETLLTLNSNDIESVTTLKDASATSIYGSRAANGVIYITLKKGRRGEQARVVINAQYGVSEPITGKRRVMNSEQLIAYELGNNIITPETAKARLKTGVDTDWRDFYYRHNAPTYQTDISITGGSESTSYYIAGGYMRQQGTAPGSDLKKYTFRTSVESTVTSWLRVGSNITMGYDEREAADETSNSPGNAALMSLLNRPDTSPYDKKGNEVTMVDGNPTPRYLAEKMPVRARKFQTNANAYLQITPVRGLNIKSQLGLDGIWFTQKLMQLPSFELSPNNGAVIRAHEDMANLTITNTIDYNFEFTNPDHKLYLLAGQEGTRYSNTKFQASKTGQIADNLMMLGSGLGTPSVSDSYASYMFNSWFGRAEYGYAGKYMVDATVRRDASSRFGADRRSAIFYSFGAMWDAKREQFLFNNKTISDLSFKVSYGTQGNSSIPNYAHYYLLNTTSYDDQTGLYMYQYGNPNLGWETQKLLTVAANIGLWNRLNIEVEFYNRITEDMLMGVPTPATSGYLNRYENVGSMRNRGVDVTLNADIVRTKDWMVNLNATFTYGKSIITKLFYGYDQYAIANTGQCYQIGHDAGEFYLPRFIGVNPENGKQKWEVINPDGTISSTEDFSQATNQQLGKSRFAPYVGGFGLNASWKGISLVADFTWAYGKYMINNDRMFIESANFAGTYNRSLNLLNEWKNPGDVTDIPKYREMIQLDSRFIENSSFLRLKNLTVAWDLPKTWLNKTHVISGVRLYFTARNLFTITDYSGYDPETDRNISLGAYPNSRQFVGGVQITF